MEPQQRHWSWNNVPIGATLFLDDGSLDWKHLKEWLHVCYDKKVSWYKVHFGDDLEPGLLRTCRKTRKEASPFFFQQNRFMVYIRNFVLQPQTDHWFLTKADKRNERVRLEIIGDPLYENMEKWLQKVHGGEMTVPISSISDVEVMGICTTAFHIAKFLRGLPRDTADRVLDSYAGGVMQAQRISTSMSSAWELWGETADGGCLECRCSSAAVLIDLAQLCITNQTFNPFLSYYQHSASSLPQYSSQH
jgi:hypothetical protein